MAAALVPQAGTSAAPHPDGNVPLIVPDGVIGAVSRRLHNTSDCPRVELHIDTYELGLGASVRG